MKITDIKVIAKHIPLKESFTIALGTITTASSVVVEVHTDEGIVGYGEGAPSPLVTGENLEGTIQNVKYLASKIIGVDPLDREKINYIMSYNLAYGPSAKAAIDIACHDIMAKKSGISVAKLLGGNSESVETDMTIGIDSVEKMLEKAKEIKQQGFKSIKIKVGLDDELDIKRVAGIRNIAGNDMKIRLDANQGWNDKQAVKMINRLEEYSIELVEQPVKKTDLLGLKFVRDNVSVPIMADESCFNSKDALELIRLDAVDSINIKLMKCGGLYEALKITTICEVAGIECMIGCMAEETNIGVTAAAHLASGIKNITRADLDATFNLKETIISGGVPLEATPIIKLNNVIGLGIGE